METISNKSVKPSDLPFTKEEKSNLNTWEQEKDLENQEEEILNGFQHFLDSVKGDMKRAIGCGG